MEEIIEVELDNVIDFAGTEIISINGRNDVMNIQDKYPNIEIIVGKANGDRPIKLNFPEMENDRREQIDAATETILGKRIDKLEKPVKFPFPGVMFILGMMTASAFWLYLTRFVFGG
jgi:hypothetical protein